jgi:hypothetical protein
VIGTIMTLDGVNDKKEKIGGRRGMNNLLLESPLKIQHENEKFPSAATETPSTVRMCNSILPLWVLKSHFTLYTSYEL